MIPVAPDHTPDVINDQQLPGFVTDVLPAGNLSENQEANLIAAVEEVARLRIMRSPNEVAFQLMLEDLRIAPLHALGHR